MRHDNPEFASYNQAQNREPNFVVEISFDSANTDLLYLTKEAVTNLTGSNVVDGVLESISGTTQKLDPRKALSTIGSMSFSAVDDTLTATQKTKLQGGDGLRGKRVRFYVGAVGLDWSGFMLAQTQIIDTVTYKDNSYTFKSSDVQREIRKDIFEVKETALSNHVGATDTTINVYSTAGFERVQHPASPSGLTDAPGQEVGYLKITQGDEVEIIRYTGKTSTTFTGCTRGVLNTKPLEINLPVDEFDVITSNANNATKVEEYVYLELPAPMLAYALLTGSIYGELGKTLPDHWHLGISTDYVKTSDFTNIGVDWWDTTNADLGIPAFVKGQKKTDGKKFIEEQIYRMLGAFSPVYSTGELGLKRLTVVHSSGGYVAELNADNVVSYGELTHDMKSVVNKIAISWNWEEARQRFTRTNILLDSDSISQHGEADPLDLKLRSLGGSRHTKLKLKERFDSIRDRYAGPPLRLDLTLTPDQNNLEVGDIVRVNLEAVKDYTGEEADHVINRNFEIQQVSTDWVTGQVNVKLFGSSQKAGAFAPESSIIDDVVASGFYGGLAAKEINATNFPGAVSSSGGVTTVYESITLTGHDDLTNENCIYYCNEDLTINQLQTSDSQPLVVTITKNVQVRVQGYLQINGKIDGKANGASGGTGVSCVRESSLDTPGEVPNFASESPGWTPAQKFIGNSFSQPGVFFYDVLYFSLAFPVRGGEYVGDDWISSNARLFSVTQYINPGLNVSAAPPLDLVFNDADIVGVPGDISGQPGAGGGPIWSGNDNGSPGNDDRADGEVTHLADGGAGGAGGAGLIVFCDDIGFGANGKIDTSGGDGLAGGSYSHNGLTIHAGKGAGGAPGAIYVILTDDTALDPVLNDKIDCYYGSSDASSYSTVYDVNQYDGTLAFVDGEVWNNPETDISLRIRSNIPSPSSDANAYRAFARVQFLPGSATATPDTPEKADDVVSFTLTEYTNTPPSQQGNISTIEVSVTAPSDPNYSHAFIQFKTSLNSPWYDATPASPEATYQVPSDGTTYYVRALSVSKDNVMSSTGPQDSITVADVVNDPDTEAPTVMTFDNITVTCESGGATFTGKDAKFSWTDTNKDKLHFLEYKVEIKDGSANLMRTERTKDAFYVYTYEKNKEDYEAYHTSAGANRSITITVTVVGAIDVTGGKYEGPTDSLSVSNPAPSAVGSLVVSPGYGVIYVNGTNPTDLDFTRFGIYIDTTAAFTAGPSNFLGYANQLPITIASDAAGADLTSGTTYYLRLESYDEFGAGSITTDYSALMAGVPAATEIPVAEELQVNGRIIADASGDPYNVVMGPQTVDSRAALFNFKNTTTGTHYFALFEDGTVEVNGKITVNSSSTIDGSATIDGTAASTVKTGATRANSGLNSSGQVTQIIKGSNLPSTGYAAGLNLTSTRCGYYDGSSWKSYFDNTGKFYLDGDTDNRIWWDGSTMLVRGNIEATSITAGAIDGETITGSTLRTASSGTRSVIDGSSNTMRFYDSGNTLRVSIEDGSGSSGYIRITGTTAKTGVNSQGFTGLYGRGTSSSGYGVHGYNSAGGDGVYGQATSSAHGVYGYNTASTGGNYAVYGYNSGSTVGVAGYSSSNIGVAGQGVTGCYGSGSTYDFYADGAGTNYAPFTGSHDALILKTETAPIVGDIVTITGIAGRRNVSNVLASVVQSTAIESKAAFGVVAFLSSMPDYQVSGGMVSAIRISALSDLSETEYNDLKTDNDYLSVNGLGEGQINVCDDNGDIETGDFICTSATPGKGQLYTGSDMRVVVAKAMEPVDWSTETESTKMIACIYMCS